MQVGCKKVWNGSTLTLYSTPSNNDDDGCLNFYSTSSNDDCCLSESEGGEGESLSAVGESLIILGNLGTLILTTEASSWTLVFEEKVDPHHWGLLRAVVQRVFLSHLILLPPAVNHQGGEGSSS